MAKEIIGKRLDEYSILSEISRGAMGTVYRAEKDGGFYALKLLRSTDPVSVARFRGEAASIARLNHPSLVRIFDANEYEGSPYIVMELLEGKPLEHRLKEGALDFPTLEVLAKSIAGALVEVHRYKIVHRDIKPANIMMNLDGTVKLLDLGLAGDVASLHTEDGNSVVGTILYSPPEQSRILKRPVDARSDLYSLGITLYEACAGQVPFNSDDLAELIRMHAATQATSLLEKVPGLSPTMAAIIAKMMEKDPDDRYQSAEGLLHDLGKIKELDEQHRTLGKIILGRKDHLLGAGGELPLAGRKTELASLQAHWRQASSGKGRAVLIEGEGGSGKSRLTQELLSAGAEDREILILRSKCQSFASKIPLAPIRELFDSLLSILSSRAESERDSLLRKIQQASTESDWSPSGISPGFKAFLGEAKQRASLDGESAGQRFHDDLVRFIAALARNSSQTVLLIDDVQWLDSASAKVLYKLAEILKNTPLLLLMTSRNDPDSAAFLSTYKAGLGAALEKPLILGPLSLSDVKEIVNTQLGKSPLPESAVTRIAEAANGNPFVITECIRSLLNSGHLIFGRNQWEINEAGISTIELSSNVFQLVLNRISGLGADVRKVLVYASIMGNGFDFQTLLSSAGISDDDVVRAIQDGVQNNLISPVEKGTYRFTHDRIREALLSELSEEQVREINDRLAIFLSRRPGGDKPWFNISRHFASGNLELHFPEALEASRQAAKLALSNFAFEQAHQLTSMAFRCAKGCNAAPEICKDVARDHSVASIEAGKEKDAHEGITAALELSKAKDEILDLYFLKMRAYFSFGRINEAWVVFKQTAAIIGTPHPSYRLSKWLQVNSMLFQVIVRMVTGWGFGRVTPASPRRKEFENLSKIYYTASFIARFRPDGQDYMLVTLRTLLLSLRLGKSSHLARALIHTSLLCAPINLAHLRKWLARFALQMTEPETDAATDAYVKMFEFIGQLSSGQNDVIHKVRDILPLSRKFLGSFENVVAVQTPAAYMLLKGRHQDGYAHMAENLPMIASAKARYHYPNAMNQMQCQLLPLGAISDVVELRKQVQRVLDSEAKDIAICAANYPYSLFQAAYEQDQIDTEVDLQIDYFKSLGVSDIFTTRAHITIAEIRLMQLQKAVSHEERNRARKELKAELRSLFFKSYLPMQKAHWYIIKAGLARWQGKIKTANRLLESGYSLARLSDNYGAIFNAIRERSRVFLAAGDALRSETEAAAAYRFADENGWALRAQRIVEEFQIDVKQMFKDHASETSHGTLVAGARTRVQSATIVGPRSRSRSLASASKSASLTIQGTMVSGTRVGSSSTRAMTQAITREQRAMAALTQVSLAATSSGDPLMQSQAILDEVVKLFGADRAFLFLADGDPSVQGTEGGGETENVANVATPDGEGDQSNIRASA